MNPLGIQKWDVVWVNDTDNVTTGREMMTNRPAVVISDHYYLDHVGLATVLYLTTNLKYKNRKNRPVIQSAGVTSCVVCEQPVTVDILKIERGVSHLSPSEIQQVEYAFMQTFQLETNGMLRKQIVQKDAQISRQKRKLKQLQQGGFHGKKC